MVRNAALPHSDVSGKRLQRDDVLRDTGEALAAPESSHAAGNGGAVVNVLMLDDLLEGRLLSAEMWARFPEAAGRLRIFATNLRADVVAELTTVPGVPRGGIVSGEGCVCNFLARWESLISATGGFAVVFTDVHDRTLVGFRLDR